VTAAHWAEEALPEQSVTPMTVAKERRMQKIRIKEEERKASALQALSKMGIHEPLPSEQDPEGPVFQTVFLSDLATDADGSQQQPSSSSSSSSVSSLQGGSSKPPRPLTVREHIDVTKSRMRMDPRPIDASCGCYTCRNFSRSYLHHLFKAKETLGGTLVSLFVVIVL